MKKILFWATIIILGFASCTSDEDSNGGSSIDPVSPMGKGVIESTGINTIDIPGNYSTVKVKSYSGSDVISVPVVNGQIQVKSSAFNILTVLNPETEEVISNEIINASTGLLTVTKTNEEVNVQEYGTKFIANYPEKKNNMNKIGNHDFVYVSDGKPINIYPIFSYTANCLALGIFYFDDNKELKDQTIWEMDKEWYDKGIKQDNRTYYYKVSATMSKAIQITLPKGTPFGFYVQCINGTNNNQNDLRRSASYLNTQKVCTAAANPNHKTTPTHCATYVDGDITYVGFEDGHSDYDFNDLIIVFDPEQEIIPNPTPEIIDDEIDKKTPTPEITEDLIHVTTDDVDVEGRFKDPYPYLRINVPIKTGGQYKVCIDDFKKYVLEQDDFHIVTAQDMPGDDSGISLNKVTEEETTYFIADVPASIESGKYEIKIELRPSSYEELIAIIKEMIDGKYDWTKLLTKPEEIE